MLLAAYPGWLVTERSENSLTAVLDFAGTPQLLASFPFPHLLIQCVTLADRTLTIETRVMPTTSAAVPLCFGYHPYLKIPDVPRAEWLLTTPSMRHLPVDDRGLPTGHTLGTSGRDRAAERHRVRRRLRPSRRRRGVHPRGGDRRIDVTFERGYPAAQLFAPTNDDLIGIEPMAAPTDALRSGNYRYAVPGKPETARYSIRVR